MLTLALKSAGASQESKDTWTIALLDMYRSTGQQASFARLAQDDAQRSARVARSLSLGTTPADSSRAAAQRPTAGAGFAAWQAPVVLDKPAVDQLQARVASGHTHTRLDWQALKIIKNAGIAGVLAAGIAPAVHAQAAVRWRLASSFPKSLDTIFGAADVMAKAVKAMSGGKFEISVHAGGELMPPFGVVERRWARFASVCAREPTAGGAAIGSPARGVRHG